MSQPVNSWEELKTKGSEGLEQFKTAPESVAAKLGLRVDLIAKELADGDFESAEGSLFIGGLKGEKRSREKVAADYGARGRDIPTESRRSATKRTTYIYPATPFSLPANW